MVFCNIVTFYKRIYSHLAPLSNSHLTMAIRVQAERDIPQWRVRERRERERLSAKKIKLHSPNLIDEPRYGARVQVGVMSHHTRRLHTCSMRPIWPSFARKRAPRQQPKTRAFLVLLSRRTRDIAATRGRPEAPRGWSNARLPSSMQASAGRCGRVLRCAPSTRASRPALHWRAVSDPKGEQGGIPKGQG